MSDYHDRFFKELFSVKAHAVELAAHLLPAAVAGNLDVESFRLDPTSYLDPELATFFSDLVYTCQYGADQLRIALLFEHKSAPRADLAYQLLQYMMGIWRHNHQQDQAMMPVVPMVLYHGKRPWRPGDFWSCFEALPVDISGYIPNFDYVFMDLSCYTDKQLKAGAFKAAAVKIGLLIMKRIYDQDNLEKAAAFVATRHAAGHAARRFGRPCRGH